MTHTLSSYISSLFSFFFFSFPFFLFLCQILPSRFYYFNCFCIRFTFLHSPDLQSASTPGSSFNFEYSAVVSSPRFASFFIHHQFFPLSVAHYAWMFIILPLNHSRPSASALELVSSTPSALYQNPVELETCSMIDAWCFFYLFIFCYFAFCFSSLSSIIFSLPSSCCSISTSSP